MTSLGPSRSFVTKVTLPPNSVAWASTAHQGHFPWLDRLDLIFENTRLSNEIKVRFNLYCKLCHKRSKTLFFFKEIVRTPK